VNKYYGIAPPADRRVKLSGMSDDVLLLVNCQHDYCYPNRHLLRRMYSERFARMVFVVNRSCRLDGGYEHLIASRWSQPGGNVCICENPVYGRHSTHVHSFHSRLVDASRIEGDHEYVLFVEDDCLLAPWLNAAEVKRACDGYDAVLPPIRPCPRDNLGWVWTHHAAGYPAFDEVSPSLDLTRIVRNYEKYSGEKPPRADSPCMFNGFVDCLIFRREFLHRIAADLTLFSNLWHETAIPIAILHHTSHIGVSHGAALWDEERQWPLAKAIGLLAVQEFVHPVKLSRYGAHELLAAYGLAASLWAAGRSAPAE
jgi:hypothetical protein